MSVTQTQVDFTLSDAVEQQARKRSRVQLVSQALLGLWAFINVALGFFREARGNHGVLVGILLGSSLLLLV